MGTTKKVVWAEGVFLGQQHFQLWEQGQEAEAWRRMRVLAPNQWGIVDLSIDEEALGHGRLQLLHCEAVFPDGRLLRLEAGAEMPARNLDELEGDERILSLALPVDRGVTGLAGYPDHDRLTAWQARYEEIPDLHDSERVREVALAEPNLSLLHDGERDDAFVTLPFARLLPTGMGEWRLCDRFIPPVSRIDASPVLTRRLRRLLDLGRAKARTLSERWQAARDLSQASSGQLAPYLCLDVLSPALTRLAYRLRSGVDHPETVFLELLELESRLTLLLGEPLASEPLLYEHANPEPAFTEIESRLTRLLGDVVPSQVDGLRLEAESRRIRVTRQLNAGVAQAGGLYLAARGLGNATDVLSSFVKQTKVCAREDLETVVGSGLKGVELRALETPPPGVPATAGSRYFEILRDGDFWQRITDQGSLAVFLAAEHADLQLELIVGEG